MTTLIESFNAWGTKLLEATTAITNNLNANDFTKSEYEKMRRFDIVECIKESLAIEDKIAQLKVKENMAKKTVGVTAVERARITLEYELAVEAGEEASRRMWNAHKNELVCFDTLMKENLCIKIGEDNFEMTKDGKTFMAKRYHYAINEMECTRIKKMLELI